jgi:glycosyltransferase involved in cell wall biosynthesis
MMGDAKKYPLVSIAMATYNGGRFLREQLQSLVAQDYTHIEIVISDDGSSDETENIIHEFQSANANIFFHKNEGEHGFRQNFAHALQYCRGQYIALCDQDDLWMYNKISRLMAAIGNNTMAYHNSLFVDEQGNSLHRTVMDKANPFSGSGAKVFLQFNCVSGHACLFKKELLDEVLPFPDARFHDWWISFVSASAGSVIYLPEILVHYRQHSTTKTDILKRKKETKHNKEFLRYQEEMRWYERCAALPGPGQPFFQKWLELYRKRAGQWFSFSLFWLAQKNRKELFYLPKKSGFGKFIMSLKLLWGLKLKKLIG